MSREGGRLRIEVRGELGALLRLEQGVRASGGGGAGLSGAGNAERPGMSAGALALQIKMDAGTGFEPVTFRL